MSEPKPSSSAPPFRHPPEGKRSRVRGTPKGRAVDPQAREDVRALLGDAPRRRDLLIEHLHQIQDRFGYLSAAASGRARGRDEDGDGRGLRSGHLLSPLRRGEGRRDRAAGHHRPRLRLDCLRAGRIARRCSRRCPALLGTDVRVLHAPCVGRCETAPVAVVGQNPVPHATAEQVASLREGGRGDARHGERRRSRPGTSTTPPIAPPAATRSRRRASTASARPPTSSR